MSMKYLIVVCLLAFSIKTSAQDRVITGRIVDKETRQPIENANIIVQGTTSGSVSDSLGIFQINLTAGFKSLLISHVSYQLISVQIPAADKFRIELMEIFMVLPKVMLSLQPPELDSLLSTNNASDYKDVREVEQNASFYGGIEYLNYYLSTNYKFPEGLDSSVKGSTYVSFRVDTSGAIENVKVHDVLLNVSMKNHLIQLFNSMPTWRPAYQRGEPVAQKILVPINYGPVKQSDETTTYLYYYLTRAITYPDEAIRVALEGTVFIYFSLDSEQNFTRLEILQGIGSGCDKMVYNAISTIPKAELKNLMLSVGDSVFVLPVDFRLDQSSTREDQLSKLADAIFLLPVEVLAYKPNDYGVLANMEFYATTDFYSVEGALKHINNANKLSITGQELSSLSPEVGKLTNLLILNLANNNLESLPAELTDLLKLKDFNAPRNNLNSLPEDFSEMRQLKVVSLAYNNFTEFPQELLNLKRLQSLDLSNNNLIIIPSAISKLKNLKILLLANNNFQNFPDEFFELNLEVIDLQGNDLSEEVKQKINQSFKNAKITL
jgi:hypothetical protein